MKLSVASLISTALLVLSPLASAERILTSTSLNPCMANSSFSASLFDVAFTPGNRSIVFDVVGVSSITGNVTIELFVTAYGLQVYKTDINPCDSDDFKGLCPMNEGPITLNSNFNDIPASTLAQVPGIAYTVPDLDAKVQVFFKSANSNKSVACVEAELSNGKTVSQKGVAWTTAVIGGLALVASAITSGLGHSNTAAHVAANAMALFGYFQAQAFIGMTAVSLPPIVASWTQNFAWSMGIIRVGFLQDLATWYQRSTGGTPTTVLSSLSEASVRVEKRSLDTAYGLAKRAVSGLALMARSNTGSATTDTSTSITVRGIERVGFRSRIEMSNIFMTGYVFFVAFVIFVVIGVLIFKLICEALVKAGRMKGEKFQDFRNGWTTVLKGILFRVVLIGYPQMVVLCFWELTRRDSAGEVALAVFTVFTMLAVLGWASSKVIRLARRSIAMHKNPAYILYSDPVSLNKWGFLYVQFKATAYYFIVPWLIYILVKGLFIATAQGSGVAQAIALVVIEAAFLITVCVLRPYMDKKTNGFNIAICVINFLSAIFLMVFSGIFGQPGIVTGVMGVVFFVYNAIFSLVLLVIVLIASVIAIFAKNPDTRYQPMRDDRGSFIKSQSQLTTELDALGATARGEQKGGAYTTKGGARIEDDNDSWSGESSNRSKEREATGYTGYGDPPRSPIHTTTPGLPSDNGSARHLPPYDRSATASPYTDGGQRSFRAQNASPSPWQRGAGYE